MKVYRPYTIHSFQETPQFRNLPREEQRSINVVSQVFPFRLNNYVIEELIDWTRIPDDPMYQLTVPQRDMLSPENFGAIADALDMNAPTEEIRRQVSTIREGLNPHPAGQVELNVPFLHGEPMEGMQHKYRETVLFFPQAGQTCHAYCTFCFRWPQFLTDSEVRFTASNSDQLVRYLREHREVTDLLITGGDPMVMPVTMLRRYLDPILQDPSLGVRTIRIGTKSLTYWPYRFLTDKDSDDLLQLFDEIVSRGYHLAIMAHINHLHELETTTVQAALRRIRETGAEIRSQSPLLRHINDSPEGWRELWQKQVSLGIIPYYMFVERNTGASRYFQVPLARAIEIYRKAVSSVSGLARTARGPSMSAAPGKVEILGVTELHGEQVFVLRFIQGRNPEWVQRPFFARFDPHATWLTDLLPAFGEDEFFFEAEMRQLHAGHQRPTGQTNP